MKPATTTSAASTPTCAYASARTRPVYNLVLAFDAANLTNVKRACYRYSEEQQKLDVSGCEFYLNLKYKFRTGCASDSPAPEEALRRLFFMSCRTTSRSAS
jgi:hypothetical protein